jgi:competence protein ComEA
VATAIPPPIVVYVSGAVLRPGVYALPQGARVADALVAAGGATGEADLTRINLARRVRDEEQVHIPQPGETPLLVPTPLLPTTVTPAEGGAVGPININTASAAQLDGLPGIGPGYAQRIVEYRESHGPFARTEEIQNVPGIGPATFDKIKDLITVH